MLENYKRLKNGVIKQISINKYEYDVEYVDTRYNSYGELSKRMSYLRYGYIVGCLGFIPDSIIDVGYGNGDFLSVCKESIKNCYANDVSNYPVPKGVIFIDDIKSKEVDVITFFDSLEHFQDINFVKELNTRYIVISLPWCHYHSDEWFKNWKHRREDEHIWHFDSNSLINFMMEMGYEKISTSNIEDMIRKSSDENKNILTGVFKKI
jgi:hypothetical protein